MENNEIESQNIKWYNQTWFVYALLIFFPIIGIPYMWIIKKEYSTKKKVIITVIFSFLTIILYTLAFGSNYDTNTEATAVQESKTEKQINEEKVSSETTTKENDIEETTKTTTKSTTRKNLGKATNGTHYNTTTHRHYTKSTTRPVLHRQATPSSDTVYITKTGKKYHNRGCSCLREGCTKISRQEAERQGYTPCKRCH